MTRVISDELERLKRELYRYPDLVKKGALEAVAKAQRDSSDREWIEELEQNLHQELTADTGKPFRWIDEDDWQALKQKVREVKGD